MVRCSARFHADQAWQQRLKERHHLAAAQPLPNNNLVAAVDPVNLAYVLRDIHTDCANLHVDGSPHVIRLRRTTLWHLDAGSGRRPPHQKRTFAVQENSDLSRRQTTMKLATDLPNGDLQHLREMTLRSA